MAITATIDEVKLKRLSSDIPRSIIKSSQDCFEYAKQFYYDDIDIFESMFLLLMNNKNLTIGWVKISQGGTKSTVVDVKLICKFALDCLCEAVILIHNHPSGNLTPSESDIKLTTKVRKSLELFDIKLLDHLIISKEDYYSFADDELI